MCAKIYAEQTKAWGVGIGKKNTGGLGTVCNRPFESYLYFSIIDTTLVHIKKVSCRKRIVQRFSFVIVYYIFTQINKSLSSISWNSTAPVIPLVHMPANWRWTVLLLYISTRVVHFKTYDRALHLKYKNNTSRKVKWNSNGGKLYAK